MTTNAAPDLLTRLQRWLSEADTAWKHDHQWLVTQIGQVRELVGGAAAELTACRVEQARLQEQNENSKEQIASTLQNPAADGCSGAGRPSCKAAECLFGLDKALEPKRWSCAFTDEVIPELHEGLCQLSDEAKVTIEKLAAQVSTLTAELAEQKANRNRDLTTLKHVIQEKKALTAAAEGVRRFFSGEQLGVSTGIDEAPTYGYGHLDVHGFWEFPVSEDCAAFNRRQHTLTAALRRQEWQPIETAPKDGGMILLYPSGCWVDDAPFDFEVGYWDADCGVWSAQRDGADDYDGPTHWMPLPDPPAVLRVASEGAP